MRFRQRLCEQAIKHGITRAARRQHTNRQFEFVNDDRIAKDSAFEKIAKALHMELRRTGPYSPWQNGNVERSHREDGKILYGRKVVTSEQELIRQAAKHEAGYNKTVKTGLNFKNSHRVALAHFSTCNLCVDN